MCKKRGIFIFLICVFYFLFLIFDFSLAAELGFGADKFEIRKGETVEVAVNLNTEGEEINAIQGSVSIPANLDVVDIGLAGSFINLWIERPAYDPKKREIIFTGIIPGGYAGELTPYGYKNESRLFTFILRAGEAFGQTEINLDFSKNSSVLLNDGKGTAAKLTFKPIKLLVSGVPAEKKQIRSSTHPVETKWYSKSNIVILWEVRERALYSYALVKDDEKEVDKIPEAVVGKVEYRNLEDGIWYFVFREKEAGKDWSSAQIFKIMVDTSPPELITAELSKDKEMFDGKYFLIFHTEDKVSGLDYYEVWEKRKRYFPVESPYVLKNQKMGGEIIIRAVDKAGNIRELRTTLPEAKAPLWPVLLKYLVIGFVIVVLGWLWYNYKSKHFKNRRNYENRTSK